MKKLVIYFSEDKKNSQVVMPSDRFDGNWEALAGSVAGYDRTGKPKYHKFIVI